MGSGSDERVDRASRTLLKLAIMFVRRILVISLLLAVLPVWAGAKRSVQSSKAAKMMDTEAWKRAGRIRMPEKFCAPKSYFRNCYEIPVKDCKRAALAGIEKCYTLSKLPAKMDASTTAVFEGYKVGRCVAEHFHSSQKTKFRSSEAKCQSTKAWL